MSVNSSQGPAAITLLLQGHTKDIGGFTVRRVLPQLPQRYLGPFVFFDHLGPELLPPGIGMDVPPHPHIGLATVTYLLEGEFTHRDSVGSEQVIRPGDVNWMVAGRGIAHSERSSADVRRSGGPLHGIQTWVALPREHEEMAPRFEHHPQATLPVVESEGVLIRVIAGSAYGVRAPTGVLAPTLYAHARLRADARCWVDEEHVERGVYVARGAVSCAGQRLEAGTLAVLAPHAQVELRASEAADVLLLGGAPLDGRRHVWWNFVASSRELIERAKVEWSRGLFAKVPGDEIEFVPLP